MTWSQNGQHGAIKQSLFCHVSDTRLDWGMYGGFPIWRTKVGVVSVFCLSLIKSDYGSDYGSTYITVGPHERTVWVCPVFKLALPEYDGSICPVNGIWQNSLIAIRGLRGCSPPFSPLPHTCEGALDSQSAGQDFANKWSFNGGKFLAKGRFPTIWWPWSRSFPGTRTPIFPRFARTRFQHHPQCEFRAFPTARRTPFW